MSLARKLYELQHVDSEIQSYKDSLSQINLQINDKSAVIKANTDLDALKKYLAEINQKRRDLEWEIDDLQKNISKLIGKLYGGKVGNPKELMSIEQETESFKTKLSQKEDGLLELMDGEESAQKKIGTQSELTEKLEREWQQNQRVLTQKRGNEESLLLALENKRLGLVSTIDSQPLAIYQGLKSKKSQAVVKIEQGRCQGCRISLSMNELQKARTGNIIQCSSCSKILYLE
jgi:predicted  nucleic acid-binding Zn-ribbon protein